MDGPGAPVLYREVQDSPTARRLGRILLWCGLGFAVLGGVAVPVVLTVGGSGLLWAIVFLLPSFLCLLFGGVLLRLDTRAVIAVRPSRLYLRAGQHLPPLPVAKIQTMKLVRPRDVVVRKPLWEWRVGIPRAWRGEVRNERGESQPLDLVYGIEGDHGVVVDFTDPLVRVYLRTRNPEALVQALAWARAGPDAVWEQNPADRGFAELRFSEKMSIAVVMVAMSLGMPLLLLVIIWLRERR